MPRDLFGDVARPSVSIGNRKWYTVPLSLLTHSAIVLVIVAIPILAPAMMPSVFADDEVAYITTLLPPTPPLPKLKPVEVDASTLADRNLAPVDAPTGVTKEPDVLSDPVGDSPVGVIGVGLDASTVVLAPPPRQEVQAPAKPLRVGGGVRTPVKTRHVAPVYTEMARIARVEGIVILEATIGADGRVSNLRVLRSIPLLDQAAMEAVQLWEFTPTHLNGEPVPVIMTVTVQFTLR